MDSTRFYYEKHTMGVSSASEEEKDLDCYFKEEETIADDYFKPPSTAKRNARERRRVEAVNEAFCKLRRLVPLMRNKDR